MRTILAACVALSVLGVITTPAATAQVVVQTPSVAVPYWREHSDWQARKEFREQQFERQSWLEEHCVRDWKGNEYCRR